jgi:hypothetical protein
MRRILCCLVIIIVTQVGFRLSAPSPSPTKKCPTVVVNCPTEPVEISRPVIFTADVIDVDPKAELTYDWSASAGTIASGQGTSTITLDITKTGGQSITATVKIGGLNAGCPGIASCTLPIGCPPPSVRKFDEYGDITLREEKVRLDRFAIQLQNEPGAEGYIIAYDKRASDSQARSARAKDLLVKYYGFDPERIVTINVGFSKSREVELWVVPTGATPPTPKPTVSPDKTSKDKVKGN